MKQRGFSPGNYRARRRAGIGGSEAAASIGESHWRTRCELWLEHKGLIPPKIENEQMELGHVFEKVAVEHLRRKHGWPIRRFSQTTVFCSREFPFMYGHLDGLIGEETLLEIKAVDSKYRSEYGQPETDDVPDDVFVQCQHNMAASETKGCRLPVVFGTRDISIFSIKRSDSFIRDIAREEKEFLDLVKSGKPPEPDCEEDLKLICQFWWKGGKPAQRVADKTLAASIERYREVTTDVLSRESQRQSIKKMIREYMGPYHELVDESGQILVTHKPDVNGVWRLHFKKKKAEVAA